jgi:hypothetical protein
MPNFTSYKSGLIFFKSLVQAQQVHTTVTNKLTAPNSSIIIALKGLQNVILRAVTVCDCKKKNHFLQTKDTIYINNSVSLIQPLKFIVKKQIYGRIIKMMLLTDIFKQTFFKLFLILFTVH